MKTLIKLMAFVAVFATLTACGKDDPEPTGTKPAIEFRTGPAYTTQDVTYPGGTIVVLGTIATRTEDDDPLKEYQVTESVNGAAATTVFTKTLTGTEEEIYYYNTTRTIGTTSGETRKLTFKVTSEKGLSNEVSLTVTVF